MFIVALVLGFVFDDPGRGLKAPSLADASQNVDLVGFVFHARKNSTKEIDCQELFKKIFAD